MVESKVSRPAGSASNASQRTRYSSSNILAALPTRFVSALLARGRPVSRVANAVLFSKGDSGDGCYWLQTGIVKVTASSDHGLDRILAILGPGAIVGELSVIDGLPHPATVEAMTDCRLLFVSRNAFLERLHENESIYRELVIALASRLRQADDELATASLLPVKARLARALLQLSEHLGERNSSAFVTIHHTLRQNDLAAMAGTARESANRIIAEWKRRKIVREPSPHQYSVNTQQLELEATRTVGQPS